MRGWWILQCHWSRLTPHGNSLPPLLGPFWVARQPVCNACENNINIDSNLCSIMLTEKRGTMFKRRGKLAWDWVILVTCILRHRGLNDCDWLGERFALSQVFYPHDYKNQPRITWIYHVTFIALYGGPIFLLHRIALRRWTQTHLGSILSKSASVFFFSSISCPVLSTTSSSKLSAYFSIMYTMLSKMFVFLLSEQQKGTLQWCYKKTRLLSQKSCPWLLQRRRSMSKI